MNTCDDSSRSARGGSDASARPGPAERGIALMAVVLVLLALAVIATPFALSMKNQDKGAAVLAYHGKAAQAAQSALELAEQAASFSDPQRDPTPFWDGPDEFRADLDLKPTFGVATADPTGSIWSARVEDEQGKLDLNQCSPFLLANRIGATSLARELDAGVDGEIRVGSTAGFAEVGVIWIEGEIIFYRSKTTSTFNGVSRAFDTTILRSRPALAHRAGTPVLDYRAISVATLPWKGRNDGAFVGLASIRALKDVARLGEVTFSTAELESMERDLTVHAVSPGATRFLGAARAIFDFGPDDKLPEVYVAGGRNLGPGSVVRIRSAAATEYNLVVSAEEAGFDRVRLLLQEPVQNAYTADEALIEALARAPVNVNTCSRELLVALLEGVRLAGSSERVDHIEAENVADALIRARPLQGEAGLDGVLAGLETGGGLSKLDRQAILLNALNAGDTSLEFGTAPFVYRNLGRVAIQAAVSENYRAGREAARTFAREIVEARPAGAQLTLFDGQMEFAEASRLSRTGKFWTTFPINLLGFDRFNEPPLPLIPMWRFERYPRETTDDPQFARLAPSRIYGQHDATAVAGDRTIHFDEFQAPRDRFNSDWPDGWRVEKLGAITMPVDDELPALLSVRGYVRPFEIEMWWTPGEGASGAESWLFDTGESEISNRTYAFVQGGILYFRVADATVPDAPGSSGAAQSPTQMAEIRLNFAEEGLPLEDDVPYHLKFYARGTKPSDMALFVDGVPRGNRAFQTRLKQSLDGPVNAGPLAAVKGYQAGQNLAIHVEDARLFPSYGVVRVGDELLEYSNRSDDTLFVQAASGQVAGSGKNAFFGGRTRRGSGGSKHLESESVELYGYAAVLRSKNIPTGDQPLGDPIGELGIAMVDPKTNLFKNISIAITGVPGVSEFPVGRGIDESLQEIPVVAVAKPGVASGSGNLPPDTFQKSGGFALLVSAPRPPPSNGGNTSLPLAPGQTFEFGYSNAAHTPKGAIVGLSELIEYSSFDGSKLVGVKRAPTSLNGAKWTPVANLAGGKNGATEDQTGSTSHVHVATWFVGVGQGHDKDSPIFVLPISIGAGTKVSNLASSGDFAIPELADGGKGQKAPNLGGGANSSLASQTRPELVQIGLESSSGVNGGGTEWVRYDTLGNGYFVRDDPERIRRVTVILARLLPELFTAKSGNNVPAAAAIAKALNYEDIAANQPDKEQIAKDAGVPATALDGGLLAFRGVLGTRASAHPQNDRMIPVFRTFRRGEVYTARPGARDFVTLLDPVTKTKEEHRINYAYCEPDAEGWGGSSCHVAFEEGVNGTFESNLWKLFSDVDPDSSDSGFNALANSNVESRDAARMLKFPSGELPVRLGDEITLGGDLHGTPSPAGMTLDEVEFFNPETPSPELPRHLRYVLSRDDDFKGKIFLRRNALRYNHMTRDGTVFEVVDPVANLPDDGVVLLVDDELIAVNTITPTSDSEAECEVAQLGRGYLGTPIQHHRANASVRELTFLRVSRLERPITEKSEELQIANTTDFPPRGVVLVGRELIGYTHIENGRLIMPVWKDPDTGTESGLLRGRYGTEPARHEQDTLVYVFPYRYEDRWHPRADDPALGYLGLQLPARGGFFRELSWSAEGGTKLADLVVQARVGGRGSFEDDPRQAKDVFQFETPGGANEKNLILRQGDGLELRVFVRYQPGAFDPAVVEPDPTGPRGGSNDWKKAPKLKALGVDWIGGPTRLSYEEWR